MDILNLIITLVSGIAGGNAAGAALPNQSLGGLGNSITGLLGGGVGNYLLTALGLFGAHAATGAAGAPDAATAAHGMNLAQLLGDIVGGGVGGGVLTAIVGLIKNACAK